MNIYFCKKSHCGIYKCRRKIKEPPVIQTVRIRSIPTLEKQTKYDQQHNAGNAKYACNQRIDGV